MEQELLRFEEFIPSDQCWLIFKLKMSAQFGYSLERIWNWAARECVVPSQLQYF